MNRMKASKIFSRVAVWAGLLPVVSFFPGCRSPESSLGDRDPREAGVVVWSAEELSRELFDQANRLRVSKGLLALQWSDELAGVARSHAQAMADARRMSHDGFDERSQQLRERGVIGRVTENVAYGLGHAAPASITVDGWNESAGHRRNLLDERVSLSGVGCALTSDGYFYFAQLYGR